MNNNRDEQFQQEARAIWQKLLSVLGYIDVGEGDDPADGWGLPEDGDYRPGYQTVLARCLYDFAVRIAAQVVNKPNLDPELLVNDYVADHAEVGPMWDMPEWHDEAERE